MEDCLKIVMTADTVGGVWTYTMELCKALRHYNAEIHLMTMGALLNNDQYRQVQELGNISLYESNYKLEWMQDPWDDVEKAREWVDSICKKVNPDIIHFNNFGQVNGEWHCPVVTVYHSCVRTWWQAVKGEDTPEDWTKYTITLEQALRKSDVIVAPSENMMELAKGVFGNFKVSQVIYNGRDISFKDTASKEPYILSAGRVWDEGKNIKLLSDIACRLSWPVYIAGDNRSPDGEVYEPENVSFVGKLSQDEMEACMSKASIFVMPAKYEPFGLAVLEAAQAGCALVLSNIATFWEIWGDAALYFDPSNEDEAQLMINKLAENEDLRREMAYKAMLRAQDFTSKRMAAEYIELYHQLIQNKLVQTNHD